MFLKGGEYKNVLRMCLCVSLLPLIFTGSVVYLACLKSCNVTYKQQIDGMVLFGALIAECDMLLKSYAHALFIYSVPYQDTLNGRQCTRHSNKLTHTGFHT